MPQLPPGAPPGLVGLRYIPWAGGVPLLPGGDIGVRARWDGDNLEVAGLPRQGLGKGRKTEEKGKRENGRNQHWLILPGGKQAGFQPGGGGRREMGRSKPMGMDSHQVFEVTWRETAMRGMRTRQEMGSALSKSPSMVHRAAG